MSCRCATCGTAAHSGMCTIVGLLTCLPDMCTWHVHTHTHVRMLQDRPGRPKISQQQTLSGPTTVVSITAAVAGVAQSDTAPPAAIKMAISALSWRGVSGLPVAGSFTDRRCATTHTCKQQQQHQQHNRTAVSGGDCRQIVCSRRPLTATTHINVPPTPHELMLTCNGVLLRR